MLLANTASQVHAFVSKSSSRTFLPTCSSTGVKTKFFRLSMKEKSMEQESHLRRKIFTAAPLVLLSFMGTPSAEAMTGQSKSVQFAGRSSPSRATTADPLIALEGLIKAKEELLVAKNDYLKKNDFEGLREYLAEKAVNMNAFEGNALSILASNMIS
jgi:hypothetical protein